MLQAPGGTSLDTLAMGIVSVLFAEMVNSDLTARRKVKSSTLSWHQPLEGDVTFLR